jgi:hypothetical protein
LPQSIVVIVARIVLTSNQFFIFYLIKQNQNEVLVRRHKQLISLFAVLAIILVQFSAQVHATDHPFHQEDALCFSLQSAAQDQHFFHTATYSHFDNASNSVAEVCHGGRITPSFKPYYSSRAPPETAV